MKKLLVIFLFLGLFTFIKAQKVIEHPEFTGTTAPYVNITKITLSDTATILNFEVYSRPNSWIFIPKDTYIRNSEGGEKLIVKYGNGIKLKAQIPTGETGVNKYALHFPPIGSEVEKIDYEESQWKIFDIELVPQEHFSIFPDLIKGNWLRTDGSNEWVYGFYEDCAICDSKIWKQVLVSQKENVYQVLLQKNKEKKTLLIKQDGNNLLIGSDESNMESFSRKETLIPGYVVKNDMDFQQPIFKNDSAWYKGYLRGYNPKMGTTGMVYINNVLGTGQESYLIKINPDGSFSAGFPMLYPQPIYINFLSRPESIYFEPGETTFQCIDVNQNKVEREFRFMGNTAKINTDLAAMQDIQYFNYQEMKDTILDMTPDAYKAYCEDIGKRELEALKELRLNKSICKKAVQIKEKQIQFSVWEKILSFNMNRESVYRQINEVPRDQREIPLERVEPTKDFYNFIDVEELNNPVSVVAGGDYYFLINRVKFADPVRQSGPIAENIMGEVFSGFESRKIDLPPEMRNLLLRLSDSRSKEEVAEFMKKDSVLYHKFIEDFGDTYREISMEIYTARREEIQKQAFKNYFGLESGFAMEVMKSQDIAHSMESSFTPLSERQKEELNTLDNEFIKSYLLNESVKREEEIARKEEAYKNKSGFVVNETPEVLEGDLFDTIMKKYKGKLVFVDFWATWCGPCRMGMERIKPLKEELKEKDIVFVYLTNPTSPEKTWKIMMPDIDGEHYRLTQDEWNQVATRFKVSGIPHYVLVGKDGKVLKDKVYFASSNAELKKMFDEYLE